MGEALKVMIVDDTITYRSILRSVMEGIPEAQVVETAPNGKSALLKLNTTPVDLILLDIEMPEMDGLETLAVLKSNHPEIGVIMVSGTNRSSADSTIKALQLGALDFISKPEEEGIGHSKAELLLKLQPVIRHFSERREVRLSKINSLSPEKITSTKSPISSHTLPRVTPKTLKNKFEVLVIGISTGGPNALTELLPALPADLGVPVLIVQHMPPVFTESLAKSLNQKSKLNVKEAAQAEAVVANTVYIAPGGKHMVVFRQNDQVKIILNEDPPENSCRPAVDVLFRSVAKTYGSSVLSVIMTGMGSDGALGVKFLKQTGCYSLTQSEETCVVYGMPKAVQDLKLADESIPLPQLADRIVALIRAESL
jgi:two-component system chemotaxis response regulator CheB